MGLSPSDTSQVLVQALPYIQRFHDRVVVVKYGGNAMTSPELARGFAEDVVLMHSVGIKPVVVHGGGPQITELMGRLGKETVFHDGLRVTDAESLEITRMVLVGKVNRDVVASLNRHGPLAVGVSGEDAGLIKASARNPDLGFVGDVESVNPTIITKLLAEGLVPVISTTGTDADGQAYNINADTVAGAIARALDAEKIIYLTDVEGLMTDVAEPSSLIRRIGVADLQFLVEDGTVSSGMIPKVAACIDAVEAGVASAHMINGTTPHVLLLEVFTDSGIGTMITQHQPTQEPVADLTATDSSPSPEQPTGVVR